MTTSLIPGHRIHLMVVINPRGWITTEKPSLKCIYPGRVFSLVVADQRTLLTGNKLTEDKLTYMYEITVKSYHLMESNYH